MSALAPGLALAGASSLALNGGFMLQHAGAGGAPPVDPRRPLRTLRGLLGSRTWVAGLALGTAGWALFLGALALAPLSLVQAFAGGGLALALPLAGALLGHRLRARELRAIGLMALGLVALALGVGGGAAPSPAGAAALAAWSLGAVALAALLAGLARRGRPATALGAAAGALYGAADVAFKRATGAGLVSPWTAVALVMTAGAFFAFQRALQRGRAAEAIGVMTGATSMAAILGGLVVLGEPLGRTPALAALHAAGFALAVVATARLAPAAVPQRGSGCQEGAPRNVSPSTGGPSTTRRRPRPFARIT